MAETAAPSSTAVGERPLKAMTKAGFADRERLLARVMLLPSIVYIVALVAIPFFVAIAYSVSDVTTGNASYDFVGLRQYRTIVEDAVFRKALWNTLIFTALTMVLVVVFGKILALVLTSEFRGKWVVRFLVLLPWTTPVALATVNWLWLLDSLFSPIDWLLRQYGLLGDPSALFGASQHLTYLGKPHLAQASVIAVQAWRLIPLAAVIMMAGITAIPHELHDATEVDGAGAWRSYWEVTFPLTLPIMAVATLFGAILTFTDMTVVRVLTNGGPLHSTEVLASWAYTKGIGGGDLGQGAAIALFLFPLLLAAAVLILQAVKRMEVL
ncbi:MAG TPA: sugar ABC transporter permease [Acidimicrobiales bacterium]|nr:sugar ABC transporter permease [Acidimicrobiales bacterium]